MSKLSGPEPNWQDPTTLTHVSTFQAMKILAEISAHFLRSTKDESNLDLADRTKALDASDLRRYRSTRRLCQRSSALRSVNR